MAAAVAWLAVEWVSAGFAWFSRPGTVSNPWVWAVTASAVYGLHQTVAAGLGTSWGRRVTGGLAAVVAAAAAATLVAHGTPWAAPLTSLLYGLDVGFLAMLMIALVASVWLGTPGCEIAALGELSRRLRGGDDEGRAEEAMWCVVGLRRLDEWEARRRRGGQS